MGIVGMVMWYWYQISVGLVSSCTLTPESGDPGASVCGRAKLHSGGDNRKTERNETEAAANSSGNPRINPEPKLSAGRQRDLAASGV